MNERTTAVLYTEKNWRRVFNFITTAKNYNGHAIDPQGTLKFKFVSRKGKEELILFEQGDYIYKDKEGYISTAEGMSGKSANEVPSCSSCKYMQFCAIRETAQDFEWTKEKFFCAGWRMKTDCDEE